LLQTIQNDLILRAARGENVERVPVWLMRQAGRILPEYRAVRAKLSGFKELAETPELAAEVTLQPVDILGVDAAIIFSDILVVPQAMGLDYEMIESRGPHFPKTLKTLDDVKALHIMDGDELSYVTDAIKIVKKELNGRVPLIGFAGAPWTIFAYMVEGGGSKTYTNARSLLYKNPEFSSLALEKITQSTIYYLKEQIKAGADMIQIFDSWAGFLGPELYKNFSAKYIHDICKAITEVPITVFAKGAHYAIEDFSHFPCNTIGLDWTMDITKAKQLAGNKTLQGNLDPALLFGDGKMIATETKKMLNCFGKQRYIANLGHGVYPETPLENVKTFINTIKEHQF
jgi:uroporphyrinogen decarboxylase